MEPKGTRSAERSARRWRGALLAIGLGVFLATRLGAIFTVGANWDEFALLHRAEATARTGVLHSGGRPGLAVVALLPFVAACEDELRVIRGARLLWLGFTLAYLAGVAALVTEWRRGSRDRWRDAALAVALLAAVPAFLDWSLQIRSDQIALAGGAWGAAALLASRRRPGLALAAGALFGVGFLATQKLVYVAALAGLLAAGAVALAREWRPGRELLRAGLVVAGFAGVFAAFATFTARAFELPAVHDSQQITTLATPEHVESRLAHFDFHRRTLGFRQYRAMLPTLVPHGLLAGALLLATLVALRRRAAGLAPLALAWALLSLGVAVALFHASAFYYFWMTLGLFPALAFAVAREPIARVLALPARTGRLVAAGFWALLLLPGAIATGFLLVDTQAVQRESLAFVRRNFGPDEAGFHPESGLFCRPDAQPIPMHFSQTIWREYGGSNGEANARRLRRTFEEVPVKFLVQSFRLNQFPPALRRFWAEHYQPYRASVFVAGRQLAGAEGARHDFLLIVPGTYRWLPRRASRPVEIDGQRVAPGGIVRLERGPHTARFMTDVDAGMLVLALGDPPGPAPQKFYKAY